MYELARSRGQCLAQCQKVMAWKPRFQSYTSCSQIGRVFIQNFGCNVLSCKRSHGVHIVYDYFPSNAWNSCPCTLIRTSCITEFECDRGGMFQLHMLMRRLVIYGRSVKYLLGMLPRERGWKALVGKNIKLKLHEPTRLPDPSFALWRFPQIKMQQQSPERRWGSTT